MDINTYGITCESQFNIIIQESKYAPGNFLITVTDDGELYVAENVKKVYLPNHIPVDIIVLSNGYSVTWDLGRKHILYSKKGKAYECTINSSYTEKPIFLKLNTLKLR